jgi:general secretion pathway protein E
MTDEIRRMVMKQATSGDIERQAVAEGMRTMYQDGMIKALEGATSAEEVLRVTQES